jgi:Golgi phosphoprotein 3 GPP34
MLLLSEALLLLLLEEEKGASVRSGHAHDAGLAGALLLDLAEAGLLDDRSGALVAVGAEPSSPALAAAWRAIAASSERPRAAKHWVGELPKRLKPLKGTIAAALVAAGVLDERRHKLLGVFPSTRYPELDPAPERALRSQVSDVLLAGASPDDHIAALLGLLVPMALVKPALSHASLSREERKAALARAKAIADRGPVGDAVKAAVQQQVTAVVIASTVAATTAATSGAN